MTLPTFLLIGAAKSGTTSLYSYLAQHPSVFMSIPKEPNFFAFDGRRLAYSDYRCDGRQTLLLRRRTAGPVFRDRDPLICPFRVTRTRLTVRRHAKVARVPVRCPRGCSGTMEVKRRDGSIAQPFSLRRGGRHVALHLDETTRGQLHDRGRAKVRVTVETANRPTGPSRPTRVLTLRLHRR